MWFLYFFSVITTVSRLSCSYVVVHYLFFFQAEGGIRVLVRSRGLGDVYKGQAWPRGRACPGD